MTLAQWLEALSGYVLLTGAASLVLFLATLAFIPAVVIRIPPDYFTRERREAVLAQQVHPCLRWIGLFLKNCIGGLCVVAGLAMLVLPGQGLLTILVGVVLIDFPGKYALERRLVRSSRVFRTLNWIRAKAGRAPLQHPG